MRNKNAEVLFIPGSRAFVLSNTRVPFVILTTQDWRNIVRFMPYCGQFSYAMSRIHHSRSADRMNILQEMEKQYDYRNEKYFLDLLTHADNVIRTRAICILADISDENSVYPISIVLKNDKDQLVRHEAAFSLGQLGFTSAIDALSEALSSDSSFFVRHEAAIALGVIGSENAREALEKALDDGSEEVRESADVALANIDYISKVKRTNKFIKMTGG